MPDAEPRVETIKAGGANKPYEIAGQRYQPLAADVPYVERGLASWYGRKFHGRPTASGEPYDMYAMTAALKLGLLRGVAPVEVERLTTEAIRTSSWRQRGSAPAVADASTSPVASNTAAPASLPISNPPDVKPTSAAPAPGFWIQLGAFRQRDGADRLHQQLSSELSWLAPVLAVFSDHDLLRVQAGPYADRAEATRVAQRVRASASLTAVVIEHR